MTRCVLLVAVASALAACNATTGGLLPTRAAAPSPQPAPLDGWARVGDAVFRAVGNSAEAGPAGDVGYLVSLRERGDFRVELEYRAEDATNGGIFVRCQNPLRIDPTSCYEINIWDNHPLPQWRTGSVVLRHPPLAEVGGLDRWVRVVIEARGATVEARFDDVVTARFEDAGVTRGRIALQYAGEGRLTYRNVNITSLDAR